MIFTWLHHMWLIDEQIGQIEMTEFFLELAVDLFTSGYEPC